MVNAPRPLCRYCAKRIPFKSYAWVTFPSGMTHLMHYCPTCNRRAGSPVPQIVLAAYSIDGETLPTLEVETVGNTAVVKREPHTPIEMQQYTLEQLKTMPYQQYLQSAHWLILADKVKRRAKGRCQLCNAAAFLQVHHRTYERRGHEYLKDLIALCGDCHAKFHDKLPKEVSKKK